MIGPPNWAAASDGRRQPGNSATWQPTPPRDRV